MGYYYSVDGVQMPSPTGSEPGREDLDSDASGRGENGVMIRVVIRSEVRNLDVKHEMLTKAELRTILTALKPPSVVFSYIDGFETVTVSGYAQSKKYPCRYFEDDTDTGSYWDLSYTFVEN